MESRSGPYIRELAKLIESEGLKGCFELGCGFFRNLIVLREAFPNLRLGGIDFSAGCDEAYERAGLKEKGCGVYRRLSA